MYILKPEMAQELKQTTSQIYTDAPNVLYNSKFVATIGDICTIKLVQKKIIPNLIIGIAVSFVMAIIVQALAIVIVVLVVAVLYQDTMLIFFFFLVCCEPKSQTSAARSRK